MKYYVIMVLVVPITIQTSEQPTTHQSMSSIGRGLATLSLNIQQSELLQLTKTLNTSDEIMNAQLQEYKILCAHFCKAPQQIERYNSFNWMQHNLNHHSKIIASATDSTTPKSIQDYFEMAYQQLLFKTYQKINLKLHQELEPKLATIRDNISYLQKVLEQPDQKRPLPEIMYIPRPPTARQNIKNNPNNSLALPLIQTPRPPSNRQPR